MPSIRYTGEDFPAPSLAHFNDSATLSVHWHEVVWAALSVGKRGLDDMLANGQFSVDEMRYRAYMIWANLYEDHGHLKRSPAYEHLDPSEKGAISYFLGMTVAKLFALRLFSAPWMVHLDRLVDYESVGLVGRSRPDLAGVDTRGRWILLEGKGRTGAYSSYAMARAKEQVEQVRDIGGMPPYLRIAAQSYFDDSLAVRLVDPEKPRPNSVSLNIDLDDLATKYYRRFARLRERQERTVQLGNRTYALLDYSAVGVSVGVEENAENRLSVAFSAGETTPQTPLDVPVHEYEGKRYVAFSDGVLIGLDDRWSDAAMTKKPYER